MLAIFLAIYTRNVLVSLLAGTILGVFIISDFNLLQTLISIYELFVSLLSQGWILKTLAFVVLVGAIMALLEKSGGIDGFVHYVQHQKKLVKSKRSALFLSYIIGVIIFVESSITALIAGAVGKPFCREYNISNAKLAYVCDSTSAPISSLLVFNGYGALLLGLITTQISSGTIVGSGIDLLISSLLYNFYAIVTLIIVFISIWFDLDFNIMKNSKLNTSMSINNITDTKASKYLMILPISMMVVFVFIYLYITGNGDILKGSGSSSVFYTMLTTLTFMYIYYKVKNVISTKVFISTSYNGMKHLVPLAIIMLLAFSIGDVTGQLKTGEYLASFASENINIYLIASVVFTISAVMAFATGTSWGTFSIMIPIAAPIAIAMGIDVTILFGAVISGAIFGDHCSPISDTTIVSSLAAECDVVEHVRTQLPYALLSGAITSVLFFLVSLTL